MILPSFRHGRRYDLTPRTEADVAPTLRDAAAVPASSAIHAFVSESEGWYVAECLEVAVVTQGRSLDETLSNLRDALALHLDDDERARVGLPSEPRLVVSLETSAQTS